MELSPEHRGKFGGSWGHGSVGAGGAVANPEVEKGTMVGEAGMRPALRSRLAVLLDGYDTAASVLLNGFLVGAIAAAAVSFVVSTFAIPAPLRLALVWGDRAIAVLFTVEYALRWWCAPRPWRYPFTPLALLDAAAIVPMLLGSDVLFLRLLRSLRILRLLRFSGSIQLLQQLGRQDLQIPIRVALALGSFLFVAAGSIYQVEHGLPHTHIHNFLDAFYFTVVTTTTVGFGDITPRSDAGRLVTLGTIAAGVILIPWQVGDLVRQFVKTLQKISDPCLICGLEFHDPDARFCKRCGAPLPEIAPMQDRSP